MKDSAWPLRAALTFLLSAGTAVSGAAQPDAPPVPAVPVDPIAAVLDAFQSHRVVALGEGAHGNEQGHAFRLSLIRDPRFSTTVNDIVVESGNARYQDLMDRFVRGEDVADHGLRQVWENTTVPNTVWDRPIYEELFRAVRAVNVALRPDRQLRVLLGDPPIDWQTVHTKEDLLKWTSERDSHPAELIRREVLAKQRSALVIYGDGHVWRNRGPGLVSLLESTGTTKVFAIATPTLSDLRTLQADVASWRMPSLALLRGTVLGITDFAFYFGPSPAVDKWPSLQMEQHFDALLYLGPPSSITIARLPPTRCSDARYMEMRLRRMALMPGPPGSQDPGERLKQYCASVVPK